jgi:molecular chaperone DnaK
MTAMSYFLAVDVGTSRTAASTARVTADGAVSSTAFGLGRSSDSAPSAIFVADGELLFGEAAERRGLAQPERLIREFKRRVGDDVPILVGDQRFGAEELYARVVAWVVETVSEREGRRPAGVCVTIPVTWGGYRAALVRSALAQQVPGPVELISEPEAAARHYESTSPLEPGRALAVYDLGGGTFDAVILRKDSDGDVRMVGEPLGLGDFGGADFDDQVLRHTIAAAGLSASALSSDPTASVAASTLRRECIEAKEALSFDSEAVVPVLVGQAHTTVRLTRSEFEEMIEGGIEKTIEVLSDALDSAGVSAAELEAILLTGGSSRIPRVAELLSERFDRPIAIDADPKAIVALGAARAMADPRGAAARALALAPPVGTLSTPDDAGLDPAAVLEEAGPAAVTAQRRWFTRLPATAAMASGALVLASGIVLASATGLGSSPVANSQTNGEQSLADWLGVTLFDASSAAAAAPDTVAASAPPDPPEAIQRADYEPPTAPRASNPRTQSIQKAAQATAAPQAPNSAAGSGSGSGTPTTTAPAGDSTTGTAPTTSEPAPVATTDPGPAPTTDPAPEPVATTDPAPEPVATTDPAPEPVATTDPAPTTDPPPATDPAPEPVPTGDPAPTTEPAPEPAPAPEPSPSPTDPV